MLTDDKRLTIREWAEDDRPREKMLRKGPQSLSDAELLAILIGSGNRDESAVELSRRIMHECQDNINELAQLSIADLCKRFKGIGEAKAITIKAALEIGKRRKTGEVLERKKITTKVIEIKRLTQGGSRQTVVDIPMLLKMALEKSAQAVVVAHNHPSGQNRPSHEDEVITRRIKTGCEAIGITLLDHIIIAKGQYYSFADEGKM